MIKLGAQQRAALEALCRTIVPAAFERSATHDLPDHVAARITELIPFHRRRALLALSVFGSRSLGIVLIGKPARFADLNSEQRALMLERCSAHRLPALRLLFSSMRRLVLHTHYGRPQARPEIDNQGPLHERANLYAWEGPLAAAAPVVASVSRDIVRERMVPAGVREASSFTHDEPVRTRICIIGSGVGGATAAAILARAGHDVVVLEEGAYVTAADFSDDESLALRTLYADSGLRSTDELNISILQGRCAGGGSTVNWMVMLRTPDRVIEEWQHQHGTEDMTVPAMRAAFDAFEQANHVAPVADHAHSPLNRLILDGAAQLGWSAHGAAVNARDCMRTGACGLGCRYDAKQGAMLTQLPQALAAGARLYCDVHVQRLQRRGTGFSISARAQNHELTVAADVVILAAGAVGTAVLLQRSGMAGPAVGTHLRLHPTTAVVGLYGEPFYAGAGIPLTAYCDEFVDLNDGYGHWIEAPPLSAGLAAVALPGFGKAHRSYMQRYPFLAPLIVLVRDGAPAGASRGTVNARGAHARIRYQLGNADRRALMHGLESAARIHFAMGALSVVTLHGHETVLRSTGDLPLIAAASARSGDPTLFSAHVNGTCRIGRARSSSGCRPDGQVHGQPGVYVMDGSLLPTAPGVNPHETIAAVTSILAHKLANSLPAAG